MSKRVLIPTLEAGSEQMDRLRVQLLLTRSAKVSSIFIPVALLSLGASGCRNRRSTILFTNAPRSANSNGRPFFV